MKKVQSNNKVLTKTQFEIMEGISKSYTPKEISKLRRTSIRAVYKSISLLKKKGFLVKIRDRLSLTDQGEKRFKNFLVVLDKVHKNFIRLNDLVFKVKILNKPKDWNEKRIKILQLKNYNFRTIELKNNKQYDFSLGEITVRTTTRNIIFFMPSIIKPTPAEATKTSMEMLFNSITKIENLFQISLIKDRYTNIEVSKNHYALIKNELANLYNKKGEKFLVHDKEGRLRLIIDYSFNLDEFEAVDKVFGEPDSTIVQKYFLNMINNPDKVLLPSEMYLKTTQIDSNTKNLLKGIYTRNEENFARMLKIEEKQTGTMETFATAMEQHLKLINALKGVTVSMDKSIKEMKELRKPFFKKWFGRK